MYNAFQHNNDSSCDTFIIGNSAFKVQQYLMAKLTGNPYFKCDVEREQLRLYRFRVNQFEIETLQTITLNGK